MHGNLMYDRWGNYVEFYRDDDGGSGYGDNAEYAVKYGTLEECRKWVANPPADLKWHPLNSWVPNATTPGSAAWCETNGDNF